MSELKIEKDIPIPVAGQRRLDGSKYPFATMKIGDSFFTPIETTTNAIHTAARYQGLKLGMRFCTRKEHDGLRVWRIE